MNALTPFSLVPALLALQFVVFGWRIAREIPLGDQGRRTWLLLSDILNIASMVAVVAFCVVWPLRTGAFGKTSRVVLAIGYVLICFTPLIVAGHYRLFSREGRSIYLKRGEDYPWLTDHEAIFTVVALIAALVAAFIVATA